jgi:hypothetical protein
MALAHAARRAARLSLCFFVVDDLLKPLVAHGFDKLLGRGGRYDPPWKMTILSFLDAASVQHGSACVRASSITGRIPDGISQSSAAAAVAHRGTVEKSGYFMSDGSRHAI